MVDNDRYRNERKRSRNRLFLCDCPARQGHREEGLQALAAILVKHGGWLQTAEGRPVYEAIQVQRAFSLMHLQKNVEANPLLEEAIQFELGAEVRSDVHCHLGRCYHELAFYQLARGQFERANALGVSEEWQPVFHYYYGYTLYELKEFQRANREFILSVQSGPSGPEPTLRYSMLAVSTPLCIRSENLAEVAVLTQPPCPPRALKPKAHGRGSWFHPSASIQWKSFHSPIQHVRAYW
jgi:tetratricopeptide (TPR) repeat protein